MNTPLASLIIPAFNIELYLPQCLDSALAQTLATIEIIVVDDGSTDGTAEIADRYAALDERIRVFHEPHRGLSAARNTGIERSQGKYLAFLDGDDWITESALESLCRRAETFRADIVSGSLLYAYDDGSTCRVGDKGGIFHDEALSGKHCFQALMQSEQYVPMVCGNLYRKDFLVDHRLHFEGTFHEDEFFTPYALYAAERVIDFKDDFYFYRQRPGSIMNSDNLADRAVALITIGNALMDFTDKEIRGKEEPGIERAFRKQARLLNRRGQSLERRMEVPAKKCLLTFYEDSMAANYGVGTYIRQLTACFDPAEWDVHVFELNASARELVYEKQEGVTYHRFPVTEENQHSFTAENDEWYYRGICYYLGARFGSRTQVYGHFHFAIHSRLASFLKERLHAKIVFTVHYTDWSFDLLGDKEKLQRILADPADRREKRVAERFRNEKKFMDEYCDRIIAIAGHSYRTLIELYGLPGARLTLVPNGLQDDYRPRTKEELALLRKKYAFSEDDKIILFAGRQEEVKGLFHLIEAFKQLYETYPDTRLIIAGSGNIQRCFDKAAPYWSKIVFTGFLPKEQLYELYAIADVGAAPSIHEEFGYVALEMLMHGLPAILSSGTGLKEISDNGRCSMLVDMNNEDRTVRLKEALFDWYRNREDRSRFGPLGRARFLEEYTLEKFKKKIRLLYHTL